MVKDITTRVLSVGDLVGGAWAVFRSRFRAILLITLAVYIPVNILLAFVPVDQLVDEYGIRGFRIYMQIMRILEGFIGVVATMATAVVVDAAIRNETVSPGAALRAAVSRWLSVIGTSILARLILIGLTLLLIVPGIIWAVYYSFIVYVVILRGLGGKKALDYSKSLVKGRWWRILGISVVLWFLGTIVALLPVLPFFVLPDHAVLGILSDTLVDLVSSFFLVAYTIFFLNMDGVRPSERVPAPTQP
jgi:uncharacterized membrane protein